MLFIKQYIRQKIKSLIKYTGTSNTLSLHRTLSVNFKTFKFREAIKFPIWVYRHTEIHNSGKIIIRGEIKTGILHVGSIGNHTRGRTIIENSGIIEIHGSTSIFRGCFIQNHGRIIFKGQNRLSEGCTLLISESLTLGYMSRLGTETYVIDSDFHYTINMETHLIKRCIKGIEIGDYNWFGTRTFIKKGVKTGNCLITAAPYTVLIKDYRAIEEGSVVAGNPARQIAKGLRRIFDVKEERRIYEYFLNHPDKDTLIGNPCNMSLDEYCENKTSLI